MSETKSRKVHQPEFKAKIGLEAIRGIKTVKVDPVVKTIFQSI